MKRLLLFMCVLLIASAVQASLVIDPSGGSAGTATKDVTVSNPTSAPAATVVNFDSATLTGTATNGAGSFTLEWSAVMSWTTAAAQTAVTNGTFASYLDGLTDAYVDAGLGGDVGVAQDPLVNDINIDPGDGIVITVNTDSLFGDLVFEALSFAVFTASERMDFLVYDSSANTMLQASWTAGSGAATGMSHTLETGDQIIVAASTGSSFRIATYKVDVMNAPEPATLVLLSLGGLLLRKRR